MLVELDGMDWRSLPVEVVARAELAPGLELDRPRLRLLARELRRREALAAAARLLRRRDLSVRRLRERLDRARVPAQAATEAVDALVEAGLVSDERLARERARTLAGREAGDELIRYDLRAQGLADEVVAAALADLEPEAERAARVLAARGRDGRTLRYLVRKGFSRDTIDSLGGESVANGP